MWLSERLVPDILAGKNANETFQSIVDSTFRESDDFKRMTSRILPRVSVDVPRTLFTLNPPASAMKDLRQYGHFPVSIRRLRFVVEKNNSIPRPARAWCGRSTAAADVFIAFH